MSDAPEAVRTDPPDVPPALQTRSRATQDRILSAGVRLLREHGLEALSVNAVATEAGVAVGSVYRRFGDKERLLGAIQAQFTEAFRAELRQRISDTGLTAASPPVEIIGAAVSGVAETFRVHAPLLRFFMLLGTQNPAVLAEGSAASIEGGRTFRNTVMLAAPALRHHADVETAIDFAYRLTYAGCAHRVIHGELLESDRPLSWTHLIAQLRLAVTAFLLTTPSITLSEADWRCAENG